MLSAAAPIITTVAAPRAHIRCRVAYLISNEASIFDTDQAIGKREHPGIMTDDNDNLRRIVGDLAQQRHDVVAADGIEVCRRFVRPAHAGAGKFIVRLHGRELCVSAKPFLDAARVLMAEGVDPATVLEMRHDGNNTLSLRATVAAAAGLTDLAA
jgi:hypothetical protein